MTQEQRRQNTIFILIIIIICAIVSCLDAPAYHQDMSARGVPKLLTQSIVTIDGVTYERSK